ncbi:MAG: hypothetical protein NC300_03720 [Bacteroidales bacterium]|nr:hypothetical protein [Clostridium sp.]MCM1203228.1 hypothetical protein [Bacteroidales bacterium]
MSFTYKSKSAKQKQQGLPKTTVKRNLKVPASNDVRIFYNSPCNNSNGCVGNVEFVSHYYRNKKRFEWTPKYRDAVNRAINRAIAQLCKASEYLQNKDKENIKKAIQDVLGVFKSPELLIYPFFIDYGQAREKYNKISINIEILHNKPFILAKTLIHEAFHIIGGCKGKNDDINDNDVPCDNRMSKKDALSKIENCTIAEMQADVFAQFVMKC